MNNIRGLKRIQEPRNNIQFIVYPEDREMMKPFVFFDAGKMRRTDDALDIHAHPHSGIGIITYFEGTDLHHGDSGDNDGVIKSGGVQWIRAGGGVWHEESYRRRADQPTGAWNAAIHQLWLQLPPELEESEVEYANLQPEKIPSIDQVKVLVGNYKGVQGGIITPFNMTYLDVALKEQETWEFQTPSKQNVGFVFPREGQVAVSGSEVPNQKMGILEQNEGLIRVKALAPLVKFVLILAEASEYPLVISRSSIHTNEAALKRSRERIQKIGQLIHP